MKKDELKKVRQVKETQNIREFSCDICPKKFESSVKLNVHVKLDHCKSNSSQTDEILVETKSSQTRNEALIDDTVQIPTNEVMSKEYEEYSCFYCELKITSELYLLEHRIRCQGATENPSMFSFTVRPMPLLYQCSLCGLVSSSKEDIMNHKKSVHENQ